MTDREKQIMGIAEIMLDGEIAREQGKIDCSMFDWKDCLNLGIQRLAGATALYNAGYRKMDEVTLRLDLGDRSAEEIKQIAEEAFNNAMATEQTLIAVPNNEEEITRKAEKEIIRWLFEHAYYSEQEELVKACAEVFDVELEK